MTRCLASSKFIAGLQRQPAAGILATLYTYSVDMLQARLFTAIGHRTNSLIPTATPLQVLMTNVLIFFKGSLTPVVREGAAM